MPNQIKVSAPGKLMLFGEHGVVYGKPCIVTSVDQRLSIMASKLNETFFELVAPDVEIVNYRKPLNELGKGEIPKGAKFVEIATRNFLEKHYIQGGVKFETVSQFKSVFGFGSSSASAVCTVKALMELFEIKLTNKEFFEIAYKTVIDIQGVGSGFDLAAAIYGQTLYYIYPGKMIKPLGLTTLPLIVGYSGIKADTATIVKQVAARREKNPTFINKIFDNIEHIVLQAKKSLDKNDLKKTGELMDLNQVQLEKLGVSTPELNNLIETAKFAGAYGAKLSGAGGGDCMIALAPDNRRREVENAITKAGGLVLKVGVNTEGVRIENE